MNALFQITPFLVSILQLALATTQWTYTYDSECRGAYRIRQFNKSVITWRIDKFSRSSNLSNVDVTQVIKNATNTWANFIPVDFRQSFNVSEEVDISIRFLDRFNNEMSVPTTRQYSFMKVSAQSDEATRLVAFPLDNTTVAGMSLRLPCLARSDRRLKAKITWLLQGHPINLTNPRFIVEQDNTLKIGNSIVADTGEYTCMAETDHGTLNRTTKIIVRDVPTPPQNVFIKCDFSELSMEAVFQYIEMSQDFPANEFWIQYNTDENEPNYWETYPIPISHLSNNFGQVRLSLPPFGNFGIRVVARNDVGDSAATMGDRRCIMQAARPSRNPDKVLVKGNTPEDVTVYWEPMPRREWNGPNFEYVVEYRPVDRAGEPTEEFKTKVVSDGEANHVVLPSEKPYQKYEVRVKARNSKGDAVSAPLTTRGFSGEKKPGLPVTGFEVRTPSLDKPTVAKFVWNPYNRSSFKGELRGYKIEHWYKTDRAKRVESEKKFAFFDPSVTSGVVYDLKPFTENYARIYAYSGGGDGPPSDMRSFTMPEGFATPVQDLEVFALSDDEVGVIWKRADDMNGVFKGYNVTWCPVDNSDNTYRVDFARCKKSDYVNSTTHYRINDLEPETDYHVEVRPMTRAGIGEPNSADIRTLPDDLPVVPPEKPDLRDAGIGYDHFNVTWLPGNFNPVDPKPLGNNHYVEYRPKGEEAWIKVPHQNKNFTVNVLGLQPCTIYEVRTVSVVEGGNGGTPLERRSEIMEIVTSSEGASNTEITYTKPVRINFNGAVKFVIGNAGMDDSRTTVDLFTVVLHQFGHAMGLRGHSAASNSLMTDKYIRSFAGLPDDVVRDIQALYGVRTNRLLPTAFIPTPTSNMAQNKGNEEINQVTSPQSSSVSPQSSRRCGRPVVLPVLGEGSRIVGGNEAEPHSWPWQASLAYNKIHRCGGVLIDSLHILTAAHCIRQRDDFKLYIVTLGLHDMEWPGLVSMVRGVREIHIYDHFQTTLIPNSTRCHSGDLALLRLASRVAWTRAIKPVCLPQADVAPGTRCIVTGWGFVNQSESNELPAGSIRSNVLRQVSVPIVPDLSCNSSVSYNGSIDQTMLCAGQHGRDACKGDSGGPLVCQGADTRWELQGIVSWGTGCGARNKPGVYARVTYFKQWIEEILETDR